MKRHTSVDKAKRVDSGCRNHGSCPYCRRSRTWQAQRAAAKALGDEVVRLHPSSCTNRDYSVAA